MSASSERIEHELDERFRARYAEELPGLKALVEAGLDPGEKRNVSTLRLISERGLAAVLKARPAHGVEAELLVNAFLDEGALAILKVGSQRGGDFLLNQLRGRWAERVVESMPFNGLVVVPFGPSGAAMPGEEDHRRVIATFRSIHLLEGKRPDLLVFAEDHWRELGSIGEERARSWPERLLDDDDRKVVREALCGIEVKSSTWHYKTRRTARSGPLSITVKDEEIEVLGAWSTATTRPVMFVQVLFDEIYCMSFARMRDAMNRGFVYKDGDYDRESGAGGKMYNRFRIDGPPHYVGDVRFPDDSRGRVQVLADGNVVPFIDFSPAEALSADTDAFLTELSYASS